jgi:iron uptake system component EfeO
MMKSQPCIWLAAGVLSALGIAACDDGGAPAGTPKEQAIADVKRHVSSNLDALVSAAQAIQAAAPAPDPDGWNATADAQAVMSMRQAWRQARVAYEQVEGAVAVLFPELDVATDERYDGFLADTGPDSNLFDGQGVTGVHAIERILWADSVRPEVEAFEKQLKGYSPQAFPTTQQQAADFKNGLARQLVDDSIKIRDMFRPLALDVGAAFHGVIGSVEEQLEKVTLAATGEEESRYANETLADMRANVDGGLATVQAFRAWLLSTPDGAALDKDIMAGFSRLNQAYAARPGPKLPPVPSTWSSVMPSAADLATDFGQLYDVLSKESDPEASESLVSKMNAAAAAMGIPVPAP